MVSINGAKQVTKLALQSSGAELTDNIQNAGMHRCRNTFFYCLIRLGFLPLRD